MIRVVGAFSMVVILLGILGWGMWETAQNDAEIMADQEALPTLEGMRVGEVIVNRDNVYLWGFDFEGRRCLWATASGGHLGVAGLTCWEKTP